MPLLCIRHEYVDTLGVARPALQDGGVPLLVLDAWDPASRWPALDEISGLLVLGGAMNADQVDAYPFLARERELLATAVDGGLPVMGVCLGAQLLARALDAPVVPAPARRIGFLPVAPTAEGSRDPLLSVFRPGDLEFHWNEDTCGVPENGSLLATDDEGATEAYRVGPKAWAVLFHPEIDHPELEGWIREAGPELEAVWGRSAEQLREEAAMHLPEHRRRGTELFRRFAEVLRDAR